MVRPTAPPSTTSLPPNFLLQSSASTTQPWLMNLSHSHELSRRKPQPNAAPTSVSRNPKRPRGGSPRAQSRRPTRPGRPLASSRSVSEGIVHLVSLFAVSSGLIRRTKPRCLEYEWARVSSWNLTRIRRSETFPALYEISVFSLVSRAKC